MTETRMVINHEYDVVSASMRTRQFASGLGFDTQIASLIATVVSELGQNIIKYGVQGYITLREIDIQKKIGIEIEASDSGPGINDIEKALQENFSTKNTLGLGLPGVKRMLDELNIVCEPGKGTRIIGRKFL
ncbi:MAG: anti-sigma regulatory factor [Pseudomonadota bacterium]